MMSKLNICRILLCFLGLWSLSDAGYEGCYIDKAVRALPFAFKNSNSMTRQTCISHCSLNGYKYAGVQYYTQCFCGHSLPQYGKADISQCNTPCKGNKDQKCGGTWRNSVFSTGYEGCYVDKTVRALPYAFKNSNSMTRQTCISHCSLNGYKYAGVQFYTQCFCGHSLPHYGKVANSQCNAPCKGNKKEMCGGTWRNSVFSTGYEGCYVDKTVRALPYAFKSSNSMTRAKCISHCSLLGYEYAGAQYSSQCFCGQSLPQYRKVANSQCNAKCSGNKKERCGGTWRNSVFSTGTTVQFTGYMGCYVDKPARALPHSFISSKSMTQEKCISHCQKLGYLYAGVQYYTQCFCGQSFLKYPRVHNSKCNAKCSGNKDQKCGGTWHNSVFLTGNMGCYLDKPVRGLPHAMISYPGMTQKRCISHCKQRRYLYAGVQFYTQCFCGQSLPEYGRVALSQCNTPCKGNKKEMCGGTWRNLVLMTSV